MYWTEFREQVIQLIIEDISFLHWLVDGIEMWEDLVRVSHMDDGWGIILSLVPVWQFDMALLGSVNNGLGYHASCMGSHQKMVQLGSRPVQKPNILVFSGPKLYPYWSTHGYWLIWLHQSEPIPGSGILVFLFMVATRYPTAKCTL